MFLFNTFLKMLRDIGRITHSGTLCNTNVNVLVDPDSVLIDQGILYSAPFPFLWFKNVDTTRIILHKMLVS